MVNLGSDASEGPIPYKKMCENIAMPARKATKGPAPRMPRLAPRSYHEPHSTSLSDWVDQIPLAMVATLIPSKQVDSIERNGVTGRQAVQKEYDNLRKRGCYDPAKARKLSEVCREATKNGKTIHIGSMLELLYLKHSELDIKDQKLKGRVVFLGDRVRDQYGAAAVFEALASSPAGMEAARFVDAYGLMSTDGVPHVIQQADAEQAYTQAKLDTTCPTYVHVPPHMYTDKMEKGVAYVMPLEKALYGHPQAGVFWERRLHAGLQR